PERGVTAGDITLSSTPEAAAIESKVCAPRRAGSSATPGAPVNQDENGVTQRNACPRRTWRKREAFPKCQCNENHFDHVERRRLETRIWTVAAHKVPNATPGCRISAPR